MKLILLPSIVILIWVLNHNIRKNHSTDKKTIGSYLSREDAANATRRKDLSNLDYIIVPLDLFPFDITLNEEKKQLEIAKYFKDIKELSEKKMLNLIGVSNTELKEKYGPANLEQLTIYDQLYSKYIRTIYLIAKTLLEEYPSKAIALLEYSLTIGSDISGAYSLLGEYYVNHHDKENFQALYNQIPDKTSIVGKTIINKLDKMKSSI